MVNAGKLVGKILAGFKRSAMLPMLGVVTPSMLLTWARSDPVTLVMPSYNNLLAESEMLPRPPPARLVSADALSPADFSADSTPGTMPPTLANCLTKADGSPRLGRLFISMRLPSLPMSLPMAPKASVTWLNPPVIRLSMPPVMGPNVLARSPMLRLLLIS